MVLWQFGWIWEGLKCYPKGVLYGAGELGNRYFHKIQ
jgi:hypothetical protein